MFDTSKRRLASYLKGFIYFYTDGFPDMGSQLAQLRADGVRVGDDVTIYETFIDPVHPHLISVGDRCVITGATILTHDDSSLLHAQRQTVAPVTIEHDVFVGRGAIVLPGVTIGHGAIVGAGAVVTRDVPPLTVVAGNPAEQLMSVAESIARRSSSGRLLDVVVSPGARSPSDSQALRARVRTRFRSLMPSRRVRRGTNGA